MSKKSWSWPPAKSLQGPPVVDEASVSLVQVPVFRNINMNHFQITKPNKSIINPRTKLKPNQIKNGLHLNPTSRLLPMSLDRGSQLVVRLQKFPTKLTGKGEVPAKQWWWWWCCDDDDDEVVLAIVIRYCRIITMISSPRWLSQCTRSRLSFIDGIRKRSWVINNDIGDHDQLNQCEDVIFKFIHQPCVMPISCEVECNKLGHEKNLLIRNFV